MSSKNQDTAASSSAPAKQTKNEKMTKLVDQMREQQERRLEARKITSQHHRDIGEEATARRTGEASDKSGKGNLGDRLEPLKPTTELEKQMDEAAEGALDRQQRELPTRHKHLADEKIPEGQDERRREEK